MASPSISTKVTLKLLIDTKNERVLFAEASKAVIDFLFNLLRLPIGTVVKLLTKQSMVGCIANLYESVENLNDNYMQANQVKDVLLNPKASISSAAIAGLLPAANGRNNNLGTSFYMCPYRCNQNVACDKTTQCSSCGAAMATQANVVGKGTSEMNFPMDKGFVKDVMTFMVMDDLVVQPMSTISSITLLNKFSVKDVGELQEKVVELEMDEGIKLLKASLQSKTVLTSVFLKKDRDLVV